MPDKFRDVQVERDADDRIVAVRAYCVQCKRRGQPEHRAHGRDVLMVRCPVCGTRTVVFIAENGEGY